MGDYKIGDKIEIDNQEYIICGFVNDFGRFWPKGEKHSKEKISPVNAFISESKANELFSVDFGVLEQIVIKSQPHVLNGIKDTERLFSNNKSSTDTVYKIPNSFRVLMYIVSILIIITILMLGKNKLTYRLKNYYLLGIEKSDIKFILLFEMIFITFTSVVLGAILSFVATYICLSLVLTEISIISIFKFSLSKNLILILSMCVGFTIIFVVFSNSVVKKLTLDSDNNIKTYKVTNKRISLFRFDLIKNLKILAAITVLISLSCSFIIYGVTYKNYFSEEIESKPGFVENDYDFQFVSTVPPPVPIGTDPETGEQLVPIFFTDNYDKLGAGEDFLNYINSVDGITKVISYRENHNMNILAKSDKIDDYFDGIDTVMDGSYNMQQTLNINDLDKYMKSFGYEDDDLILSSEIIGYMPEQIEYLKKFIVDGEINIDKLISGEEIILRVPAYKFVQTDFGSMVLTGVSPADYTDTEAENLSMYKVGDEITLSGILTEEFINGAVIDKDLSSFYRRDVKVKIGAIIRNFDDVLYTSKIGAAAVSVITVNDALDKLNIPALYSVMNIYTDIEADNAIIADELEIEGLSLPYMTFENWSSDVRNYKIYNLLVAIFAITLVVILAVVAFILFLSQFYIKTNLSLPVYSLYRINGLSFNSLLISCFAQVIITYFIGVICSVPITIYLLKKSMKILNLQYYLSVKTYILIALFVFLILIISLIPSIILLGKRKNNILMDNV
jgi:hypothetical protein